MYQTNLINNHISKSVQEQCQKAFESRQTFGHYQHLIKTIYC